MFRITLLLAALALVVGFASAEQAEGIDVDISVEIEEEEKEADTQKRIYHDDIVKIGEGIVVKENEVVEGDVVCIGGTITIAGTVEGDAVCIGGTLKLDSTAVVEGDAVAVGGSIKRHDDARIDGESISVGIGPLGLGFPWKVAPRVPGVSRAATSPFPAVMALFIFVLVIAILVATFLPSPTKRLETTGRKSFWKCFLIGLLGEVVILPFIFFLVVSVVGIALIPLVLAGFFVAFYFGKTGISLLVGNTFLGRFRSTQPHIVAATAMGVLLIHVLVLLGGILAYTVEGLGVLVVLLGLVALWVAWTTGLGAVVLTRFGTRVPADTSPEPKGEIAETP